MERTVSRDGAQAIQRRWRRRDAVARAGRVGAALTLLVTLSGCSMFRDLGLSFDFFGGDGDSEEAMAAADGQSGARPDFTEAADAPPRFAVGDRFTFDNPTVTWTVEEVKGDRVRWAADSGAEQVTAMNPLLPALSWKSARQGQGRRLISDMSRPFFPLEVGKKVTFTATVSTDAPPYAWEFTWRCEVLGTERVETPAGAFGTYRIACGRKRPDELVFSYAPAVGHYVRMASAPQPGGKTTVRDLVDFESRHHIAFVDPKTSALTDDAGGGSGMTEGGGMSEMPPANLQVPASEGGAEIAERDLAAPTVPDMDNPMDEKAPHFDDTDDPVLIMGEGSEPQSALTREGASKSQQAARSGPKRPESPADEGAESAESADNAGQRTESSSAAIPEGMTRADALPEGSVAIHLASYKKPENVETGWRRLTAANGDLLGNVRPIVRRVTLEGKGTYQRLLAGPLASMQDAKALCKVLESRDVYCNPMQL